MRPWRGPRGTEMGRKDPAPENQLNLHNRTRLRIQGKTNFCETQSPLLYTLHRQLSQYAGLINSSQVPEDSSYDEHANDCGI